MTREALQALAAVCGCGDELHAFSSPVSSTAAASAAVTGPTFLPRLMSKKGTRRRVIPGRNVGYAR